MATTTTFNPDPAHADKAPGSESTVGTDAVVSYDVIVRLTGTIAQVGADWTTLVGTNIPALTSSSAVVSWQRKS